jgi:predicted ArsR family transcriptional regulator
LIAEILADAVENNPAHAGEAASRQARIHGRALGTQLRGRALLDVLAELGFEPDTVSGQPVRLHNCPFHALASRHTDLVCGLNHDLLSGLLEGLGLTGVRARLAPRPGACCVELTVPSDRRHGPANRY